ncbi:acyl-CoA desaturase [soil metagenome]
MSLDATVGVGAPVRPLSAPSSSVSPSSSAPERYRAFGAELDALKARTFAEVGEEDVKYVKSLDRFSIAMEVIGRVLIHVSPEPISFLAGVGCLFVHKQLQAAEIGHTSLHGAYDKLPDAAEFHAKTYSWDVPIDEESWRLGHNVKHHGNTNVAGKDPDIHFGPMRLTAETPHAPHHRWQVPFALGILFPNFTFLMNLHFTGLHDVFFGNGLDSKGGRGLDVLPDLSPVSKRLAWKRALRKYIPYYLRNYVFFPALAGPFFWKVLLGNWMAETMRDVYSAATIHCGHVGHDVASYPEGTKPRSRGEWYAMQVASANDFEVGWAVSVLCGGLDRQIEHHLFPTLAPQRLRQIAPEVRTICEKHGVTYKSDTWWGTLKKAFSHLRGLADRGDEETRIPVAG